MQQSLTLVLSGQAGQGLKTIETLLVKAIKKDYWVYSTNEIMSRIRGGNNSIEIRLSTDPLFAYKEKIDLLFLLNDHAFTRMEPRLTSQTKIFGESSCLSDEIKAIHQDRFIPLSLTALAKESGSMLYTNTLLFGYISGLLKLSPLSGADLIRHKFSGKKDSIIEGNLKAYEKGYALGEDYSYLNKIPKVPETKERGKIINGTEAIAIGAIAGGLNYMASYPMSPATGVLEYAAAKGDEFDIVVEQAEDEIAAMNMVIGAWYAGARAMATTSGGGFALMEEAVSLSGITETPCVIHIAQRPGPGTGLPTRTEQGDLNLAVYSGHGEFPRIVLAPGTLEEGIELTQKAFYLADKYQVPVFVLSDQFYLDSKAPVTPLALDDQPLTSFVVSSDIDYKRYALTENGISPRAVPGLGKGLVKCDSDEHDEWGFITEDFDMRIKMNDKRLGKEDLILQDSVPPILTGPKNYKHLIIGWGSTHGVLQEGLLRADSPDTAYLHITQPYPLAPSLKTFLDKAEKIVVFENNATGQLASLLKLKLDMAADDIVLKYNGVPFSVEEVTDKIKEVFA